MKPNFTHKIISLVAAIVFAVLMTATSPRPALAQTNTFPTSGNAGARTTTPADPLDVSVNQNSAATVVGINNSSAGVSAQAVPSFFEGSTQKAKFAVNSSGASSFVGGANAFQIWNFMNSPIVFGTNSAERMRIDSNGNVGIGTTSPGYKLDVSGNINAAGTFQSLNTASTTIGFRDGDEIYRAHSFWVGNTNANGGMFAGLTNYPGANTAVVNDGIFFVPAYVSNWSQWVPTLSIRGTSANGPGNVGIGITTPGYKFDVQGGQINSSGGFCIAGDCKRGHK